MRLYRVEDASRRGPWKGRQPSNDDDCSTMCDWCAEVGLPRLMHNDFPTAPEEGIALSGNYTSCFHELKMLEAWFPRNLRAIMAREGLPTLSRSSTSSPFNQQEYQVMPNRITVPDKHVAVVMPYQLADELMSLMMHIRKPSKRIEVSKAMRDVAGDVILAAYDTVPNALVRGVAGRLAEEDSSGQ